MNRRIALFLIFLCFPWIAAAVTINVFSSNNGKGLEASREILKNALVEQGHTVIDRDIYEKRCQSCAPADLNIFFEVINAEWLDQAALNWFIPNPEWYLQKLSLLNRIDLILCRTHDVERIFVGLNKRTFYMGFSSRDCFKPSLEKDFRQYLHIAGGSPYKGTKAIMTVWKGKTHLDPLTILIHFSSIKSQQPNVTVIKEKIPVNDLRILQNSCGIHLCPSEVEGYGHYLMEAMSTGAVVVTTDAPPMNEFIEDERCLVPYHLSIPCRLGTRYFVDPAQLAVRVQALMALSPEELQEMGNRNRENYLRKTAAFHQNLKQLMQTEFP